MGFECPLCGNETIIRTSKKDWQKYYVCIHYPKCKGKISRKKALLKENAYYWAPVFISLGLSWFIMGITLYVADFQKWWISVAIGIAVLVLGLSLASNRAIKV